MRNITVPVTDQAYHRARVWAAERDASLSRIVQYLIETLPTVSRANRAFPVLNSPTAEPIRAFSELL
jgi:hypothetical protein